MGVSATDGVGKSESNESWTDVLLVFSKAVAMDSHCLGLLRDFFQNKNKLKKQKTDLSFNNL